MHAEAADTGFCIPDVYPRLADLEMWFLILGMDWRDLFSVTVLPLVPPKPLCDVTNRLAGEA